MSEEQRESVWQWIVAMLIGLPLLYVASFGPACWICWRRQWESPTLSVAYAPIIWLMQNGPDPVRAL
jgi:hypothetical protein